MIKKVHIICLYHSLLCTNQSSLQPLVFLLAPNDRDPACPFCAPKVHKRGEHNKRCTVVDHRSWSKVHRRCIVGLDFACPERCAL